MILLICLRMHPVIAGPVPDKNHIISSHIEKDSTKLKMGIIAENPQDISPLLNGETIPVLNLIDLAGKRISLNELISQKPSILIFYRGGWCPYCSKQLSGIQLIEKDLHQMGYQVIAVSTDSPENLTVTMNKQKLSYTLLSDADLYAAKQFGIAFKAPTGYEKLLPEASDYKNKQMLLPVPSIFILDKKGKILFEYINPNFTERISPQLLKAAAGALINL